VAAAVVIGQVVEYYDFFLYASAAALVFGPAFFPSSDPHASTAAAFATFAGGFLLRPAGAVLFGHLGDRIGRRPTLVLTLALMGSSTTLIGVLPTHAEAGLAAPVCLVVLRCVQGLSMGGEWGGAVLLALEHAPHSRRTAWGALPQVGSPVGLLLSTGGLLAVSQLPDAAFQSWGWRIPFLAAAPLMAVGVLVRRNVEESPDFLHSKTASVSLPLVDILRRHRRGVFAGILLAALPTAGYYVVTTFTSSYVVDELHLSRNVALVGLLACASVQIVLIPVIASLAADREVRRFTFAASIAAALWALPFYGLVQTGSPLAVWLAQGLAMVALSVVWALLPATLAQQFPVAVRYTGVSLALQGASVLGGFAPVSATGLLAGSDGGAWPTAGLLIGIALASALGSAAMRGSPGGEGPRLLPAGSTALAMPAQEEP
jgi:predicted MFS family arabinose efflux permease